MSLRKNTLKTFYHTTTYEALDHILDSGLLLPKDGESFVSLSAMPFRGDIRGNDVVLRVIPLDEVIEVKYNRRWFNRYPEQASYIAGEGWREQFEFSEDTLDEDGFPDPDLEEQELEEAMYEAFVDKKDEEEWISLEAGEPLRVEVIRAYDLHLGRVRP